MVIFLKLTTLYTDRQHWDSNRVCDKNFGKKWQKHSQNWASGPSFNSEVGRDMYDQVGRDMYDQAGRDMYAQVGRDMYAQVGRDMYAQVGRNMYDHVGRDMYAQVGRDMYDQVGRDMYDQVGRHVWSMRKNSGMSKVQWADLWRTWVTILLHTIRFWLSPEENAHTTASEMPPSLNRRSSDFSPQNWRNSTACEQWKKS